MTDQVVKIEQGVTFEASLASALARYDLANETIAAWREQYMPLRVEDPHDKAQIQRVHDARMIVKRARVQIEATRKELKADALRWGQAVDGEARRIVGLLDPIEKHLEGEEDSALQALENERLEFLRGRMAQFQAVGAVALERDVERMSDEQFATALADATERHRAEQERIAAEKRAEEERLAAERAKLEEQRAEAEAERQRVEAERKIEADRLAKERAALEAERVRLAAEQEAERKRQEAERAEAQRKLDEARAAQEAEAARIRAEQEAERAKLDAQRRELAEREEAARRAEEERERAAQAERDRIEAEAIAAARAPEAEKVRAYAIALERVPIPSVWCSAELGSIVNCALTEIRALVNGGAE